MENILKNNKYLEETKESLLRNYLADNRPWIVAFSGGKDSTEKAIKQQDLQMSLLKKQKASITKILILIIKKEKEMNDNEKKNISNWDKIKSDIIHDLIAKNQVDIKVDIEIDDFLKNLYAYTKCKWIPKPNEF